jgi:DNA modification methylase
MILCTTALVARRLGRQFIGSELSSEYMSIIKRRLATPYTLPMFETISNQPENVFFD